MFSVLSLLAWPRHVGHSLKSQGNLQTNGGQWAAAVLGILTTASMRISLTIT